jgi:uncharacterized membrane protein YeaQ/YmgE (transglycosylase-associated protein family)
VNNEFLPAGAGWSENWQGAPTFFEILRILAIMGTFVAIAVIIGLVLQRVAEMMIGQWRTTTRELMWYMFLVALLGALLVFMRRM